MYPIAVKDHLFNPCVIQSQLAYSREDSALAPYSLGGC